MFNRKTCHSLINLPNSTSFQNLQKKKKSHSWKGGNDKRLVVFYLGPDNFHLVLVRRLSSSKKKSQDEEKKKNDVESAREKKTCKKVVDCKTIWQLGLRREPPLSLSLFFFSFLPRNMKRNHIAEALLIFWRRNYLFHFEGLHIPQSNSAIPRKIALPKKAFPRFIRFPRFFKKKNYCNFQFFLTMVNQKETYLLALLIWTLQFHIPESISTFF